MLAALNVYHYRAFDEMTNSEHSLSVRASRLIHFQSRRA